MLTMDAWRLKNRAVRIWRPVVTDLHHFDEEQDPDQHQSEKSNPDPLQSEKKNLDTLKCYGLATLIK